MISVKSIAACARVPGAFFELWKDLILLVRPDLSGTPAPHSVTAALSGFRCIDISDVPDFDQQWNALANRGRMYCHPTSALNWMNYLSQHHEPSADSPADPITDRLQIMADYMDTDPDCGTDFDDAIEGIADWCDDRNVPVIVSGVDFDDEVPIQFEDLESTILFGGLINLRIGRYTPSDDGYEKEGGHAVSLVGLEQVAGQLAIHLHDPNDETKVDRTTQSPTKTVRVPVTAENVTLDGETGWALRYSPVQFVVGFLTILPIHAVADGSSSTVVVYQASWDGLSVSSKSFGVPFSGGIADIALHPGRPMASVLDAQSGGIWNLDLGRGTWKEFATVLGGKRLAYHGRSNVLVAFSAGSLTVLDAEGRAAQRLPLDMDVDDAVYDFRSDLLLAAAPASGRVLCFTGDLRSRIEWADLVPRGRGRVLLSLDARQRRLTVSRPDSADVISIVLPWGLRERRRSSRVTRRDDSPPARFTVQRGELVAQRADGVRLDGSALNGIRGYSVLRVAQTGHNVNPRHTGTRKWRDQ
jgi:hypothetical protein